MTQAVRAWDRRPLLIGGTLGLYAAAAALAPGWLAKAALCAPLLVIPIAWSLLRTPNRWLTWFLATALLLPPFPIALGDSGPHVALLFAAAGFAVGLMRIAEWRFQIDAVPVAMLALLAIALSSVGMAVVYSGAVIAAGSLARVCLFGVAVFVFFYVRYGPGTLGERDSWRAIHWLYWAAVISALFACIDFYFQFPAPAGYAQQFVWIQSGVYRRAQGVFYEASTLGNLCAFFLIMIAVAVIRYRTSVPLPRWALFAGGTALAGALVVSYSRASLLNLGVAIAVLLWMHRDRIRWRRAVAGIVLVIGGAAAFVSAAFPTFAGHYLTRLAVALEYFWESPNQVMSGRLENWNHIAEFIASEPWRLVTGIGYKTLPYTDVVNGGKTIGDNTYLSFLVETGFVGLLAVIALNVAILTRAWRTARSSDALRAFCGTWMFCFWAGQSVQMLSADLLTYWRVLPVYFFILALAG